MLRPFECIRVTAIVIACACVPAGNAAGQNTAPPSHANDISAFFGHNVSDLQIKDLQVVWGESLPAYFTSAIELEDFSGFALDGFAGRQAFKDSSVAAIELRRGHDVSVRDCVADTGTGVFFAKTAVGGIGMFANNDLYEARKVFKAPGYGFFMTGNRMPRVSAKASAGSRQP